MVERKFIHECGLVGHIEDIVVHSDCRGKKFGQLLVEQLTSLSEALGCYKVILASAEGNAGFYEKCGYSRKEIEMAKYRK